MPKPNVAQILKTLGSMGTEQNRVLFRKRGATDPIFGVSPADLEKFRKQIGVNHELALELWRTGNLDARMLAAQVADPQRISPADLDRWASAIRYYPLADIFATKLAARSRHARDRVAAWTRSKDEWLGRAGWMILGELAQRDQVLSDAQLTREIERIESTIHPAPNFTRDAMNKTLIAIGSRNPRLRELALTAARRMGKVKFDHPDGESDTPDAATEIRRYWDRKAGKSTAAKKPAAAAPAPAAKAKATSMAEKPTAPAKKPPVAKKPTATKKPTAKK